MSSDREHGRLGAARAGRLRPAPWLVALVVTLAAGAGLLSARVHAADAAAPAADAAAPAAAPAAEQAGVRVIRRGTPHDALYDVAFEGRRGVAVGAFGSVLATADGGATWERQAFPMSHLALLSVTMREGKCIAVGQTGLIYAAEDCKAWKATPSTVKNRLLSVSMNKQGLAYAVGAFGTVLRSADWGKTWAPQAIDWTGFTEDGVEPHLYDVHVGDDGVVTTVGEFELVLRSSDGKAWKALHKGERSLFALAVLDGGRLYASGQSGAVLTSRDDGATWESRTTGTQAILTGVHATPAGQVLASGINAMVVSRDGGASWQAVNSKLVRNAWYQALASSGEGDGPRRLMAVGAGGSILELGL